MASSLPRLARAALTMRHPMMIQRAPRAAPLPTIAVAADRARPSSSSSSSEAGGPSSSLSRDRSVRRRPASPRIVAQENDIRTSPSRRRKEKEDDSSSGKGMILLPVRRSGEKGGGGRTPKSEDAGEGGGLDDRARAKMAALSRAKEEKDKAMSSRDYDGCELRERRDRAGRDLARAYSQAIKYTSRLTKSEGATRMAEGLLYEWMDGFMAPLGGSSAARMAHDDDDVGVDDDGGTVTDETCLNKKWTVRTAHNIARRLACPSRSKLDDVVVVAAGRTDVAAAAAAPNDVVHMPPPSSGDYVNLLRSYSASKARRKGQRCEALMKNMMTLADSISRSYGSDDDDDDDEDRTTMCDADDFGMEMVASGDGDERTERWRTWVKESIPNSKVFALAIKCHAGSTRPESLERIILLNNVHDGISDCCRPHVTGMYKDDPYVLFHSIKALKNLQKEEDYNLGKEWLGRLHKFVTSAENEDYFQDGARETDDVDWDKDQPEDSDQTGVVPNKLSPPTIDVTSAYTTMIRLMARLRGKNGVAVDAREVLDRMHGVHDVYVNGLGEAAARAIHRDLTSDGEVGETSIGRKPIASIDIRSNAYNLLMGLYKDSKNAGDATRAIELLQRMVDAGRKAPEDRGGVPLPTEVSFEYAITSIANMADGERALDEAERLIKLMQDQEYIESSVIAYNAFIVVCNRQLFGKSLLYDKALDILDRMNELGKTNPIMLPNPETLALVMKSCALSEHKDHKKVLETASNLFLRMKENETDEKSNVSLTDRAYYYMMKCVDMYSNKDPDAKMEQIQELFSEACQRGLCSANVLACFRSCVSEEDYRLTVGQGRLADHWIANIKGPRALYTDGSKGGANKNARRKGKSTSDWVKKSKAREVERETMRNDKKAKKSFKKVMNSSR